VTKILGVDIGGVLIDRANDHTDTSFFSGNYLNTTAVPGAFEAISFLNKGVFKNSVFLVSKCGLNTQRKTLEWLKHNGFYDQTGLTPDKVHFCFERAEKEIICKRLGVTHFVDDRLEVLSYLESVPHRYLFQGSKKEIHRFSAHLHMAKQFEDWKSLGEALAV
jgi:hypothetical protein